MASSDSTHGPSEETPIGPKGQSEPLTLARSICDLPGLQLRCTRQCQGCGKQDESI